MDSTCARCVSRPCGTEPENRKPLPRNCPAQDVGVMEKALEGYDVDEEVKRFYVTASEIEALGYGKWCRVREVIEFCRRMGYRKIGLAFCRGLSKEAKTFDTIMRRNGFEMVSVMCKTGGIDKEEAGISPKVHPDTYEPMCNPIAQALTLNEAKTEFNVVIGLCVGHDSLFYANSKAYVTTLVVKDRVLANNPAGALYCADGYYAKKLQ